MKLLLVLALALGALASPARAQQERAGGPLYLGLSAGLSTYYFGEWPAYPMLSGRMQHRFFDVVAVEANVTGVAAAEAYSCPQEPGSCVGGQEFRPIAYPGLGIQMRLPTRPVSAHVGRSIGVLVDRGMVRSTSYEAGVSMRVGEAREYFLEVRRRNDERFVHVPTKTTEFGLGVGWAIR